MLELIGHHLTQDCRLQEDEKGVARECMDEIEIMKPDCAYSMSAAAIPDEGQATADAPDVMICFMNIPP